MPLKIHLKKGQQIFINGAVLENPGPRAVSLLVKNEAAILRDADVITPEEAVTPAGRVYYALQCLYMFPDETERYLPLFKDYVENYRTAAPSSENIVESICEFVDKEQYYMALKRARNLIDHEGEVLSRVTEQFAEEL